MTLPARPPRSWLTDPVESGRAAGLGVYLHVPFCSHRCGYCDFATVAVGDLEDADRDAAMRRYVTALTVDLARQVAAWRRGSGPSPEHHAAGRHVNDAVVTSVFIGGGTPSLLPEEELTRILDTVRTEVDVAAGAEITVEANPESVTLERVAAMAAAGVTRVSLGAQSLVPALLAVLERGHGVEDVVDAVDRVRRAGIAHVNVDLIYGTPGESDADWVTTLSTIADLDVDHVSAYALSIHTNTPFGRAVAQGRMQRPDDDVLRDRFDVARALLAGAGLNHYEVSNWSRGASARSRHNVLYWRHGDYLGVGVGAHAHRDGVRAWTTRSTEQYVAAVEAGGHGAVPAVAAGAPAVPRDGVLAGAEALDDDERAAERLLLGLRVREGLHPADLPPIDPAALERAMAADLVETACGRVRATAAGWFLLDEAVQRLTG
jgi:putative oxygen-independent coproporphyrinogen III oxidase